MSAVAAQIETSTTALAEARLRLAYINQHRELGLAALLAAAAGARVLGAPVGEPVLLGLGLWLGLAILFVRAGGWARRERQLHAIEGVYFALELGLITLLAREAGAAVWLGLVFFLVSTLYAHMVLPRGPALALTALAAGGFAALVMESEMRVHSLGLAGALAAGALAAYALAGLTVAQFSHIMHRQAEALHAANLELNANGQELRLHRDHLEELVRQRTADLQRASDELRQANHELRRLNEIKGNFLANVSHELRTPLTSIRSFSELLLNYPDEDIFTRCEFLEIILNESDRLTRLINDVLDMAKIEAERMEWRPRPLPWAQIVRESLEVVQVVAAQKGLRLVNAVGSELPWVNADPDRLRQVLINLLSNALKFTPSGSIEVGTLPSADEVVLYVADTGMGIAASELPHIFDKFHQHGNALTDKPAGTGLGLSICREIIEHHGGRIWAESPQQRGSIFYCALPAVPAAMAAVAGQQ